MFISNLPYIEYYETLEIHFINLSYLLIDEHSSPLNLTDLQLQLYIQ